MLRRMLIAATLVALAAPGLAQAQNPVLRATVGPGFTIEMTNAAGGPLGNVQPGTYDIIVRDLSSEHNFHLTGPGVNRATTVGETTTVTWTVTLADGVYTFVCDPHRTEMRGSFTVGTGTNPPPPSAPPPPPPAGGGATLPRLVATVGPGFTIRLTRNGRRVRTLKAGRYRITVNDRSAIHDFHLTGRGVNRKTAVAGQGTRTWTVTFRKGSIYRFLCDPHARTMRGSFRAT